MIIRRRVNGAGSVSWQLDQGKVDGVRLRKSFCSREDAEAARSSALALKKATGAMGQAVASSRDLFAFMAAEERLRPSGASIHEAVDFFIRHGNHVRERVLMPELVDRFIAAKKQVRRSARTLQTMRVTLLSLARALPNRPAHEVTRDEVQAWLHGNKWSPRTINNRLKEVRTLFIWAIKMKLATVNPCDGMDLERIPEAEIETLTLAQCKRLLDAASASDTDAPHKFLAYVTLGLFCGLRRSEMERLRWEGIDLKGRTVIVQGGQTKTARRRVVDVPKNAIAFLKAKGGRMKDEEKIVSANFKDDWIVWRREHGFGKWPNNALRHTFASMHYAMFQNESLLKAQMGTGEKMLHRHYRALQTREEARKFWALRPES